MSFPKIEGYVVTEKLGSGSYSTVYKAYTKVGARSVVAVKCVERARVRRSCAAVDNLVTEIRLLKKLRHEHIVTMHDFTWDDKNIYIITEYCSGGDLSRFIKRYGRVPEKQVRYFLQQLVSALQYLHSQNVAHLDLKPHNLLLSRGQGLYVLKVADFGFAQLVTSCEGLGARGSPLYMAPEMFKEEGYDHRADLWSVGVILYESLYGRAPYSSATFKELVEKIQNETPIEIPATPPVSQHCKDLLRSLLTRKPEERITHEELFKHSYVDLDHMPTQENYNKAVQLLTSAVQNDAAGVYASALPQYCEGLRCLMPRLAVETGARKKALSDKIDSYMKRAEDLKAFLNSGVPLPPLQRDPVPAGMGMGMPKVIPCCVAGTASDDGEVPFRRQTLTEEVANNVDNQDDGSVNNAPTTSGRKPSRGADFARRLFGRRTQSVNGRLDKKDCDNEELGHEEKPDKLPMGENANEMCKIT